MQHHLEEFISQFKWVLVSRQMFDWLKEASTDLMTDIQRAAQFYYFQHNAFGAKLTSQTFGTSTALLHKNLKVKISHIYSNLSDNLGILSA